MHFSSYSLISQGVATLFSDSLEYSTLEVEKDSIHLVGGSHVGKTEMNQNFMMTLLSNCLKKKACH